MLSVHPRPLLLVASGILLAACTGAENTHGEGRLEEPPPISAALQQDLEGWLAQNGREPLEYVLNLFEDHDVVILGEQHRIRHDELFVQDLIARLHTAGVHVFATEFGRRSDQALIDSLLAAPGWYEELGREIMFRQFMAWGFREYLDLYRAAWRANRDRPDGTPPLKVLGLNSSMDYSQFKSEADWDDPRIWERVLGNQTEADWARPVLDQVQAGAKVLIHCGIHHAFTGYRQPRVQDGAFVEFGRVRMGNHLREELGDQAITVFMHAPWAGADSYAARQVHPAGGRLDAFMLARQGGPFAVGFDVAPSPLADLPISNTVYRYGREPFSISDFCDGWIYTKPVSEYEPVTYIDGWINEQNVTRAQATAMNPRWRTLGVAELNEGCRSYLPEFKRFYGHLR